MGATVTVLAGDKTQTAMTDMNGAFAVGKVPAGTFIDYTDKPWQATTVSLVTVGGMPTLTATVPAAMFGSDGGCEIGTIVAVGFAQRDSSMAAESTPFCASRSGEFVSSVPTMTSSPE